MVLGAKRFGVNLHDREGLKVGENVFIHKSVPEGWWNAYFELSKKAYAPMIMMARHCLAPYTWTECLRIFEPVGIDRWAHELGLKYGMRDGLTCPVGARWVVVYWSRKGSQTHFPRSCAPCCSWPQISQQFGWNRS